MTDPAEADSRAFVEMARREVPAPLLIREVLRNEADGTFWVDSFRVFSTGLSFAIHYRWAAEIFTEDDPESWPDITGISPQTEPIHFGVTVDGELWTNSERDPRPLHILGASTTYPLSTARWWLPRLPHRELVFEFRDGHRSIAGTAAITSLQSVNDALDQVIRQVLPRA